MILGYAYYRVAGEAYALVSIGLVSFAAVAQFAPAMLGGMYWKGGTRTGAIVGLVARLHWSGRIRCCCRRSRSRAGCRSRSSSRGRSASRCSSRSSCSGIAGLDPIAHSLFWSMLANLGGYIALLAVRPAERTRAHAGARCSSTPSAWPAGRRAAVARQRVADELQRAGRPLPRSGARGGGIRGVCARGAASRPTSRVLEPDAETVHFAEMLLAGAIGAASARVMVATVVQEEPLGIEEVLDILDEASQVIAYSRQLEEKSRELEAATRGAARGQRAAEGARPAEGRLHVDGDARAAHAADVDPRAVGDPVRRAGPRPGAAHAASSASSSRRASA